MSRRSVIAGGIQPGSADTLTTTGSGSVLTVSLGDWQGMLAAVGIAAGLDPYWQARLASPATFAGGLHLAVFTEPYLRYLLNGRKTVESRFGVQRSPPFGRVLPGDVILLKRSAGPICGLCEVVETRFYPLSPGTLAFLRATFAGPLGVDGDEFWRARERMRFASLLRVDRVRETQPISCDKRDRRGWVVLKQAEPGRRR